MAECQASRAMDHDLDALGRASEANGRQRNHHR
jgi:hypothetical protein